MSLRLHGLPEGRGQQESRCLKDPVRTWVVLGGGGYHGRMQSAVLSTSSASAVSIVDHFRLFARCKRKWVKDIADALHQLNLAPVLVDMKMKDKLKKKIIKLSMIIRKTYTV